MLISVFGTLNLQKFKRIFFFFLILTRFILDDSALYLSDKCDTDVVDLRRGINVENDKT